MRKTKFLALTAALSLLLGTQAMAAPSIQGNVNVKKDPVTVTVQAGSSTAEVEAIPYLAPTSQTPVTNEEAKTILGTQSDCAVYMFDVSLIAADNHRVTLKLAGEVTLEFSVPEAKPGAKAIVRHWKDDGTVENLPATAGEGTVKVTFTSLSPIAILVEKDPVAPTPAPDPAPDPAPAPDPVVTQDTSARSPKTAETAMIYVLEAAVVLSFVGLVVFTRKEKK